MNDTVSWAPNCGRVQQVFTLHFLSRNQRCKAQNVEVKFHLDQCNVLPYVAKKRKFNLCVN